MIDRDADGIEKPAEDVLRESVRMRCEQTGPGALGLAAVLVALAALFLGKAPVLRLLGWFLLLACAMAWRVVLARRILPALEAAESTALARADASLRRSSILNQLAAGSGVWLVAGAGSDQVAFFITLVIALFGVGAMINLTTDYRSFRASIPLLMGQPVLFWLMSGFDGLRIAIPLVILSGLMLSLVRRSAQTFAASVRMRSEKNALLERVEGAKANAERALEVAREAMRSKAMFLAAASHDLRQPLYAISILSDTLASEPLSEGARMIVAKQRQAISVMGSLFDNLLDLSRFDAGEIRPVIRAIRLRDVVASLDADYEVLCHAKALAWTREIPEISVRTDPELLRRLLDNLLSNAVRYTENGGVHLAATADEGRVTISVSDTGRGIPIEQQTRVFGEFVQLDNPARDRDKGVGLGLSIVKRIDELLGTSLVMASSPGKGTRFSLQVPLDSRSHVVTDQARPRSSRLEVPSRLHVWLVEDDTLVRDAVGAQFKAWGVRCSHAASRTEAQSLRDEEGAWPDAVILDDMLGAGEQGLEIARFLSEHLPKRRILLVTGNVDPERRRALEESGFAVLRKPLASADLAEWLAACVERNPG